VQGDVRTFDIPAGRFSHVLHFAGSTRLADYENSPLDQYCTIVDGTSRVLKFAHNCGAKRFLLASSGAIYGLQPENLAGFPENYEGAPLTTESRGSYANCKRAAEQLCTLYHDHFGMQTVITRGFAFSGPHLALDTHHAFGSLMSDALKGHTLEVLGDGTTRRSFLYGADLCVWLLALLFQGVAGQAYNIGSAQELSIYQLASAIAAQFGLDIHVHKTYSPGSPIHRYIPDTTKATALGLRETVTLDQAISRTAQFYRRAAG
jgi:dTDP-glucose 4,6-dehydratase